MIVKTGPVFIPAGCDIGRPAMLTDGFHAALKGLEKFKLKAIKLVIQKTIDLETIFTKSSKVKKTLFAQLKIKKIISQVQTSKYLEKFRENLRTG
ncbi:MAG TPA: hypothetical protein VGP47_10000 [Parachlamydiaceae bacterium]|nr:hypothetical protein [Parachlamydiaceae bacterium]